MTETLTAQDADTEYRAVPYARFGEPGYDEYQEAQNRIGAQFKNFLHETYLEGFPKSVADVVYGHAYSEGHHSGFQEIETYYVEIAETVTRVVDILNLN